MEEPIKAMHCRSYTKASVCKQYVLAATAEYRKHWGCTRVDSITVGDYKAWVSILQNKIARDPSVVRLDINRHDERVPFLRSRSMLNYCVVKVNLIRLLTEHQGWMQVKTISPDVIRWVEGELSHHIVQQVKAHPTLGKTFKP